MLKKIIFSIVFLGQHLLAQQAADNLVFLTRFYASQQNWEQLKKLEPKIMASNNADLISSLGKLYYYQNDLNKAEKYFKTVSRINPDREIDIEYFFTVYMQGYRQEANYLRKRLSVSNLEYVNINIPESLMDYASLDAGVKVLENRDLGGNLTYASLMFGIDVTSQILIEIGGSNINQRINEGDLKQQEAHLGATVNVKNLFQISPAGHYTRATYDGITGALNFVGQSDYYTGSLSLSKRFRNLTVMPNLTYSYGNNDIGFIDQNSNVFNQSIKQRAYQFGLGLSYRIKLNENLFWSIAPSFYQINQEDLILTRDATAETESSEKISDNAIVFNSTFYYKKFSLAFNYLKKGDALFSRDNAKYFYNFLGVINYNLSAGIGYQVSSKLYIYFTGQKEQNVRSFDDLQFNYNNYFLTLIYKF